ncbi:polymerase, partial [Burkholderia sp. Ac-20379]|nr:polymerase [Burkholderia sp. Ac-20379]
AQPAAPAGSDGTQPPWLAGGDPVRLSPEMLRHAFASRRFPQARSAPDVRAAWLAIGDKAELQIDLAGTDIALLPAARRFAERLVERTPAAGPAADAEADTLYLGVAMIKDAYHGGGPIGAAVVDYLMAQYGLRRTIDLMLDALQVQTEYERIPNTPKRQARFSTTVDSAVRDHWSGPVGDVEIALRAYLSCAGEADWQAARGAIEARLPSLHPLRQPVPALLLPDAPELSNALARQLADESPVPHTLHWLLLTATEPDAIAAAARCRPPAFSSTFWTKEPMTATVLRERGSAACAVLDRGAHEDAAGA